MMYSEDVRNKELIIPGPLGFGLCEEKGSLLVK